MSHTACLDHASVGVEEASVELVHFLGQGGRIDRQLNLESQQRTAPDEEDACAWRSFSVTRRTAHASR
jgi:hypothetical protein